MIQRGAIRHKDRYLQAKLLDFSGLQFERKITPTDVDLFVEFGNTEYIIGEFKLMGKGLDYGQRLALSNLLNTIASVQGKRVFGFVAEFNCPPGEEIQAANCTIAEYWHNPLNRWVKPSSVLSVKDGIELWRSHWRQKRHKELMQNLGDFKDLPLFEYQLGQI